MEEAYGQNGSKSSSATGFSVSYDRMPRSRENETKIEISILSSASRTTDRNGRKLEIFLMIMMIGKGTGKGLSNNRPSRWPKGVRVG